MTTHLPSTLVAHAGGKLCEHLTAAQARYTASISSCGLRPKPTFDPARTFAPCRESWTLAEFERELISERTIAGLASARARGRTGGRPFTMTPVKVRLAMASMGRPDTKVGELGKELGISRQTLYRHVTPNGEARLDGVRVLSRK